MGFKPQRGKFTPDLAVENPELFRVSNPNGVNLHLIYTIAYTVKFGVSNPNGVNLHGYCLMIKGPLG